MKEKDMKQWIDNFQWWPKFCTVLRDILKNLNLKILNSVSSIFENVGKPFQKYCFKIDESKAAVWFFVKSKFYVLNATLYI